MAGDSTAPTGRQPSPLVKRGRFVRFAIVGLILASVAAAFLYLGGWFRPHAVTPARFTDAFEKDAGIHSGFRRNHAKGVCVGGFFESNGKGARLSKAAVFQAGQIPVIGRFSVGGGNPSAADSAESVRGLGLQFSLPDGETWRTAMINLPVFPFSTPQAFYDQLLAAAPDPKTGKPDPAKLAAFGAQHPEAARAGQIIGGHPFSSGFGNSTFNALNAFWFTNGEGAKVPVRWSLVPVQAFVPASAAQATQTDQNYLFDELIGEIRHHPLQWRLVITVGQPGDPTNDASIPWPDTREQVDAGTITLDRIESDDTSPARDINFDPLVLPAGMAPSDDPLLSARSAVYSQSFTRRAGEKKEPSAITPSDVRK